jgi:hypothetical protein
MPLKRTEEQSPAPRVDPPTAAAKREKSSARFDPKPRPTTGAMLSWNALVNSDPEFRYVWAHNKNEYGLEYYLALGYEIVRWNISAQGGKLVAMNARPKAAQFTLEMNEQPVESRGNTLVQMSRADHELLDQHGDGGATGQASLNEIERRMAIRNNVADPMRGIRPINTSHIQVQGARFDDGERLVASNG